MGSVADFTFLLLLVEFSVASNFLHDGRRWHELFIHIFIRMVNLIFCVMVEDDMSYPFIFLLELGSCPCLATGTKDFCTNT
jgi:hypothetical protein